jgi:ribosomal protein S18 acetylase RimI-like enzyme
MEESDAGDGPDAPDGAEARSEAAVIEPPEVATVDTLVDLWVALASDQRAHDSHILPAENRSLVRETLARQVVTDGLRIARSGDEVVGFVSFDLERGAYEQDATRGVVRNVYVVPEYRGRGIGSDLMDAAESALRAAGATVVSLEAMAGNDRARAFYRDRGYTPHRIQFEKRVGDAAADGDAAGDTTDPAEPTDADAAAAADRASPSAADPSAESDTHSKED